MFLAIINDAYEKVHEKVREGQKYKLGELMRKRAGDLKQWFKSNKKSKPPKPNISSDEIIKRLKSVPKDQHDLSRTELVEVSVST